MHAQTKTQIEGKQSSLFFFFKFKSFLIKINVFSGQVARKTIQEHPIPDDRTGDRMRMWISNWSSLCAKFSDEEVNWGLGDRQLD